MGLYVMSRSITEMGIGGRMENGSRDSCLSMLDDQEKRVLETENMMMVNKDDKEENGGYFLHSSSSVSSIGKNSDEEIENENDDDEVQSSYNKGENGSFDSLQALEEALPTGKGISRFYTGHSKSFPCLADVSSYSSMREISKAEDVYRRRRRNSVARSLMLNKHNRSPLKISGGISKRSRRSTLKLAVAMTNSSKNSDKVEDQDSSPSSLSPHYSQIRQSKFNSFFC